MENRTARLTVLLDPRKKKLFEEICAQLDLTPSQVVRRLLRQFIIDDAGSRKLPEWLTAAAPRGKGQRKAEAHGHLPAGDPDVANAADSLSDVPYRRLRP